MSLPLQIAYMFGICLIGQVVSKLIEPFVKFPASVIAMLILSALLITKTLKRKKIKEITGFFLDNISFFYLPACVGIMEQLGRVYEHLLPILVICVVSTILTFATTAYTVSVIMKIQRKIRTKKEAEEVGKVA